MKVFIEKVFIEAVSGSTLWVHAAEQHSIVDNMLATSFKIGREWARMDYTVFAISSEILQEFTDILSLMDMEVVPPHHFRMHCEGILGGECEPVH